MEQQQAAPMNRSDYKSNLRGLLTKMSQNHHAETLENAPKIPESKPEPVQQKSLDQMSTWERTQAIREAIGTSHIAPYNDLP